MKGSASTALVSLMVCALTSCAEVNTHTACASEDAVDIRYLGTTNLRVNDHGALGDGGASAPASCDGTIRIAPQGKCGSTTNFWD